MLRRKVPVKILRVKLLKDVKHFSLWQLVIFVLIFASIGGFYIYKSMAVLCACGDGGGGGPTAPSNLYAQVVASDRINLYWTASQDSSYPISYYKVYCGSAGTETTTAVSTACAGLAPGTTYQFYVVAYDTAGYVSASSNIVSATTFSIPPSTPTNLSASTFDDTEIDLAWSGSAGASGYRIYRNNVLLATTSSTSYNNTGLASATGYSYYVIAYNAYGSSGSSNAASGITYSSTPPTVPLNFTSKVISASSVVLSWNASTPGQVPIKEYDIYEFVPPDTADASGQLNGQFIASTPYTSYQVNNLSANTSYGFYVIAVDTSGNFSDQSYEAIAKTNTGGYNINVSLSASAYDVNYGQALGLVWSSTPYGLTCTKQFDSNSDATDSHWSGTVPSNTTGSQFLYPPNTSTDYLTYYYEISCTNGVSTAMSGVTVTVAPTPTATSFQANLLSDLKLSGETTSTSSLVHLNGAYTDPFRNLRRWGPWAFRPWRIDQGVDYAGIGPVYAVGSGTVETYSNRAGWPTGHFIAYKLNSGPAAGLWIYVAEVCRLNPNLHVGSSVTSNTVLCTMYKKRSGGKVLWGIETGWATRTSGSYVSANGGPCTNDGHSVYGRNFSHFMGAIKPQDAGAHRPPRTNCSGTLPIPPYHQWAP